MVKPAILLFSLRYMTQRTVSAMVLTRDTRGPWGLFESAPRGPCSRPRNRTPLGTAPIDQLLHHCLNHLVGALAYLLWGEILHGMWHTDNLEPRHAKGVRLCTRGVEKDFRGQDGGWNLTLFECNPVVHTARRARPSVGEGFDDHIAAAGQFLA